MAFIFRSPHYKTILMLDPPIEVRIRGGPPPNGPSQYERTLVINIRFVLGLVSREFDFVVQLHMIFYQHAWEVKSMKLVILCLKSPMLMNSDFVF